MNTTPVTPQEIVEYKTKWLPGYPVRLHSDLDWKGKDWCRKHLPRHKWSMIKYTDVYEHTFYFENKSDADNFEAEWPDFTNQQHGVTVNAQDHAERN